MQPNIIAIIEARMSSKRLYGKVLKKINNKEVLKIIIQRLGFSKLIDKVVVATTTDKTDDKIENFLKKNNFSYYRGSLNNVLGRVVKTGEKYKADVIVRVTADNPLTDPKIIDYMLKYFLRNKKINYLTNNNFGVSRKIAAGLDICIFTLKDLKKINKLVNNKIYKEYPTTYFYTKGKNKFTTKDILLPKKLIIDNKYRLTLDNETDLKFFRKLFSLFKNKINPYTKLSYIKKILTTNPSLRKINSNIKQFSPKL